MFERVGMRLLEMTAAVDDGAGGEVCQKGDGVEDPGVGVETDLSVKENTQKHSREAGIQSKILFLKDSLCHRV